LSIEPDSDNVWQWRRFDPFLSEWFEAAFLRFGLLPLGLCQARIAKAAIFAPDQCALR